MTNKPMLSVELRAVISMILNALDRDCEEGKLVRGEMAQELRAILEKTACIKCNDTGEADSGGVQPWGEGINIPCDCVLAANQQGKPVAWVNDQQLLLCSQSPREVWPENPMVHNLPRNIAGSALRTDYCNTPLFSELPAPVAVLMPEPYSLAMFQMISGFESVTPEQFDLVWSACRAEMARLNGDKP